MQETRIPAAWAAALVDALAIAKGTRIGPAILVINQHRGMGVHAGDLLAGIPLAGAAAHTLTRRRTH